MKVSNSEKTKQLKTSSDSPHKKTTNPSKGSWVQLVQNALEFRFNRPSSDTLQKQRCFQLISLDWQNLGSHQTSGQRHYIFITYFLMTSTPASEGYSGFISGCLQNPTKGRHVVQPSQTQEFTPWKGVIICTANT